MLGIRWTEKVQVEQVGGQKKNLWKKSPKEELSDGAHFETLRNEQWSVENCSRRQRLECIKQTVKDVGQMERIDMIGRT